MLTDVRIRELSNKKGVKKIAVENFLYTVSANRNIQSALLNLEMDSKMYKWNSATVNAIRTGIKEYFAE